MSVLTTFEKFNGIKTISSEVLLSLWYRPMRTLTETERSLVMGLMYRKFNVGDRCSVWYGERKA